MSEGHQATRTALIVALAANVLLIGALGYAWSRGRTAGDPPPSTSPSTAAAAPLETPAPAPALAPVHLSPQRLQQIGVTTALVRRAPITDHLQAMGNVAVDQGRVSYVQLRFAGWIQHVFASTPFQHVHQGDRLFTIYSPDLVTTERDYLLARQNAHVLAGSPVPGVSQGAASLLDAAGERLRQWNVPARAITALERTGQ